MSKPGQYHNVVTQWNYAAPVSPSVGRAEELGWVIDAEFPGGNILIDSISETTAYLRPDLRDTSSDWFYWYFRVTGAAGKTLTFVFNPAHVGVRGPAISQDAGASWNWLGAEFVHEGEFSYSFGARDAEVRFSVGMPYVRSNWDQFLSDHRESPFLKRLTLTHTTAGREVSAISVSDHTARAPIAFAITGRHHACEMMGSYAIEGLIAEAASSSGPGEWLRRNIEFLIVPFMDTDGVEQGDQGKNRRPHDHNRDYAGFPIYQEVRAWKEFLPAWSADRPLLALDIHDPALSGPVHESIFFIEPEDRILAGILDELIGCLLRTQRGTILVQTPAKLAFGSGFNSGSMGGNSTATSWTNSLPNTIFAASLEVAYAEAMGCEVNADSARELGRDLAVALRDWLPRITPKLTLL
ncbi:hypothetical protein BH09VER1_BH09VER1_08010 [soil metagenome]